MSVGRERRKDSLRRGARIAWGLRFYIARANVTAYENARSNRHYLRRLAQWARRHGSDDAWEDT